MGEGKVLDIAASSLGELERDGAKAVISTIVLMELWDAMMATYDGDKGRGERLAGEAQGESARGGTH